MNKKKHIIFIFVLFSIISFSFIALNSQIPDKTSEINPSDPQYQFGIFSFMKLNSQNPDTPFSPTPPGQFENFTWGVDEGDIIAYKEEVIINDSVWFCVPRIFNISDIGYFDFSTIEDQYDTIYTFGLGYPGDVWRYAVKVTELYYNYTTKSFSPLPKIIGDVIYPSPELKFEISNPGPFYFSTLNFTEQYFKVISYMNFTSPLTYGCPPPFIPLDDDDLELQWYLNTAAPWLGTMLEMELGAKLTDHNPSNNTATVTRNLLQNPFNFDPDPDEYIEFEYYDNGTCKNMVQYTTKFGRLPAGTYFNWTRIHDLNELNLVDEVDWGVDVNDSFYIGMDGHDYKINITNIVNTTFTTFDRFQICQEVQANLSLWNETTEQWELYGENMVIGRANEFSPLLTLPEPGREALIDVGITLPEDSIIPLVVPKNAESHLLAYTYYQVISFYNFEYGDFGIAGDLNYSIIFNEKGFKLTDLDTFGYESSNYFDNGTIEFLYRKIRESILEIEDLVVYYKNFTQLSIGPNSIKINKITENEIDINITLNINVTSDIEVRSAAPNENPMDKPVIEPLIFIDFVLSNKSAINKSQEYPISIEIKYDINKYYPVEVYYFNTSTTEPAEQIWQWIEAIDDGKGNISIYLNHSSLLALAPEPDWDPPLYNQFNDFSTPFSYDVNATYDSLLNIKSYWIDDTSNFSIGADDGVITNATVLSAGVYWLDIGLEYQNGHTLNGTIRITPEPEWDPPLDNQIVKYGTPFSYDVNATYDSPEDVESYWIDDTSNFSIDANGVITNAIELPAGVYWLKIRINYKNGYTLEETISVTVKKEGKKLFFLPPPTPEEIIPGYDLLFVFLAIGISIILVQYHKKK